jgi:hypothetical protein
MEEAGADPNQTSKVPQIEKGFADTKYGCRLRCRTNMRLKE